MLFGRGKFAAEAVEHATEFVEESGGPRTVVRGEEFQVLTKSQLGVEFGDRAFGVRDELDELARGVACLALGNIGRDRDRCAAHLGNKAELFIRGKLLGEQVNLFCEREPLLPDNKITVTSSFGSLVLVTRHKSHVTRYYLSDQIEPSP